MASCCRFRPARFRRRPHRGGAGASAPRLTCGCWDLDRRRAADSPIRTNRRFTGRRMAPSPIFSRRDAFFERFDGSLVPCQDISTTRHRLSSQFRRRMATSPVDALPACNVYFFCRADRRGPIVDWARGWASPADRIDLPERRQPAPPADHRRVCRRSTAKGTGRATGQTPCTTIIRALDGHARLARSGGWPMGMDGRRPIDSAGPQLSRPPTPATTLRIRGGATVPELCRRWNGCGWPGRTVLTDRTGYTGARPTNAIAVRGRRKPASRSRFGRNPTTAEDRSSGPRERRPGVMPPAPSPATRAGPAGPRTARSRQAGPVRTALC
jgi:hypothetical protein